MGLPKPCQNQAPPNTYETNHVKRYCVATLVILFVLLLLPSSQMMAADEIRFDRDIRPILSDKCFFCHGPDAENRQADLRLDLESEAKADAIVAGDPQASELIARILSKDTDSVMPPPDSHKELDAGEIELLTSWVKQGAKWNQHWAYLPPTRPALPKVPGGDWARNPIDEFVLAKIYGADQEPKARATREKLLRRVTFDLTGLPPTIAQLDEFLNDSSADAYEKAVDRLLQSNHYGERMALMWMDASRYGDTSVYHADGPREMWAWRDAIVRAYNDNMAFDQFSILQLAGDLVPDLPDEQKILAGFNRNNGTTDEGGAFAEEYRVEYAIDRVKTTATVWMGLTMECAQCHDHKYDPISQEEYYRFFAFFNVSSDGGMQSRKGNANPMIQVPDPNNVIALPKVAKELATAKAKLSEHETANEPKFKEWITAAEQDVDDADAAPADMLAHFALEEGKGKSISDSVDAKRKGKLEGGKAVWAKSDRGQTLKFDGKVFVDVGDVADFERTDSFSYGGWVKPAKGNHGALIAKMDDHGGHRGFDLLCGSRGIEVHIINTWPTNAIKVKSKKTLKADQWQHVYATYDGTSKASGIKIYIDGEEVPWNIEQDRLSDTIKTTKTLLIGSRHPGSRFKGEIDEASLFKRELSAAEVKQLAGSSPIRAILEVAADKRTDEQVSVLRDHYFATEDKDHSALKKNVDALIAKETQLKKPMTSVMIMGDMAKPRETFVLNRGAYDSPSQTKVTAGSPSVLPPMGADLPANRLGLAKWLFQDDHPLTARVVVNRYWQLFFGTGLVATPEDFGAQGDFPSHPKLLDWLAVDFREHGWNIKRLVKQIVTSSTYCQTSQSTSQQFRSDPKNRLIARGPRFRLQGEFIRDNALMLSGLLVDQFGGPGVKPYQPPGLWKEVGLGGNPKFVQDHGDKLYRRSLYTYWKRSAPPPSMQIFDAPTREKCTVQRARTNTPLQALVTLNDTQFVEAARNFAQQILAFDQKANCDRIKTAFRQATARLPDADESQVLSAVLDEAKERYTNDLESAKKLLAVGESKRDESLDVAEHAAWTIVATAILNLDETLTRE